MKRLKMWLLKRIAAKNPELIRDVLGATHIEGVSLRAVNDLKPGYNSNCALVEFYITGMRYSDLQAIQDCKSIMVLP